MTKWLNVQADPNVPTKECIIARNPSGAYVILTDGSDRKGPGYCITHNVICTKENDAWRHESMH